MCVSPPPQSLTTHWLGRISFDTALAQQEEIVSSIRSGTAGPILLLLEHDPVFTIGRTRDRSSLGNSESLPYPLKEINRGGQATYHGPGQLVAYLLLDLHHHGQDLHRYLRFLEEVIIAILANYHITGQRQDGLTGVWVSNRKIASIGVGVRNWITMHGFALNIHGPLPGFHAITPCGITGVEMTSIEQESGIHASVEAAAHLAANLFAQHLPTLATKS